MPNPGETMDPETPDPGETTEPKEPDTGKNGDPVDANLAATDSEPAEEGILEASLVLTATGGNGNKDKPTGSKEREKGFLSSPYLRIH